jgi:hypothetical protein
MGQRKSSAVDPKSWSSTFKESHRLDDQKPQGNLASKSVSRNLFRANEKMVDSSSSGRKHIIERAATRRYPPAAQQKFESTRPENTSKQPAALPKSSHDPKRIERLFAAEPHVDDARVSNKNRVTSLKNRKYTSQELNSMLRKIGQSQEAAEKSTKSTTNVVKDQRKYANKSCSPIRQFAPSHNAVKAPPVASEFPRKEIQEPLKNGKLLQKIEEVTSTDLSSSRDPPPVQQTKVQKSSSPRQIGANDSADEQNGMRMKRCKNCGEHFNRSNGVSDKITQQVVRSVVKKYPYLTDVADSVKSLIHVPSPIIDILKNRIAPAMLNRHSNLNNISVDSDGGASYKSSANTSPNAMAVRQIAPFGVVRKVDSPKNPKKNIYPQPMNPPLKPPRDEWVSPLPHTPGFEKKRLPVSKMREFNTTPRESSPSSPKPQITTFRELSSSSPKPQINAISPKTLPDLRTDAKLKENIPDKCIEWYKKIADSERRKIKRKVVSKCDEWMEKIAGEGGTEPEQISTCCSPVRT